MAKERRKTEEQVRGGKGKHDKAAIPLGVKDIYIDNFDSMCKCSRIKYG